MKTDLIPILSENTNELIIPRAVEKEIVEAGMKKGKPDAYIIQKYISQEIIKVEEVKIEIEWNLPLGRGELETIFLGVEEKDESPLVCIDDIKAERLAQNYSIKTCSTDILLLKLLQKGTISGEEFNNYLTKLSSIAGYPAIKVLKMIQIADILLGK